MRFVKDEYVFCKNLDSLNEEIHIHETMDERFSQRGYSQKSICGKHNVNYHASEEMSKKVEGRKQKIFDEIEARRFAAELQNSNQEVCGSCVSHLYFTDNSD